MKATTSLFAWTRSETVAVLPLGTTGATGAEHLSCAKAGAASMTKATVDRQIPRVILVLLRSQALSRRDIEHKKREPSKLISLTLKDLLALKRDSQTFHGRFRFPTRRTVQ